MKGSAQVPLLDKVGSLKRNFSNAKPPDSRASKSTNTLNISSNDVSGSDKMTTLQVSKIIISYTIILIKQMAIILQETERIVKIYEIYL